MAWRALCLFLPVAITILICLQDVPSQVEHIELASTSTHPREVAFFFQTNALSVRVNSSLRSVREHLPQAPIYLLSDGGPDFSATARAFNATAFWEEMHMHLSGGLNRNFTCRRHLGRIARAARWAQSQGAKFLVSWEEDTRLLRAPRMPSGDLITMGNVGNTHVGAWSAKEQLRLRQIRPNASADSAGDLRRSELLDAYAKRNGYSAGPGSAWRIQSFLRAFEASEMSSGQLLDAMYDVQDMCWEDFAIQMNLTVLRNTEVQQVVWMYGNLDYVQRTRGRQNFDCLLCYDRCKTQCACAEGYSLKSQFKWLAFQLLSLVNSAGYQERQNLMWLRPCGRCQIGDCWQSCQAKCPSKCPAVIHPHKATTLDCF